MNIVISALLFVVSWQQAAFLKKVRKIVGCGSLREDFYTRFKPNFKSLGCGMAKKGIAFRWRGGCCRSAICISDLVKY